MKNTIVFVFGTRPELIKMAPLILESKKNPNVNTIACSTGQHKEMLDNLYEIFGLKPDIDFALMKPNQNLVNLHAEAMQKMLTVIETHKPDWIVVQGDTSTAHAAAIAAFYCKVPVAHVEAGLRTYDIHSPFPEELNRRAIGLVAKVHLCPTEDSARNLNSEKTDSSSRIHVTGNTGIDALKIVADRIDSQKHIEAKLADQYGFLEKDKFILATMHRRENFGDAVREVLKSFLHVVKNEKLDLLLPIHPNPNVKAAIDDIFTAELGKTVFRLEEADKTGAKGRVLITTPLDYAALVYNMKRCKFLMSDSGGLQEEAPTFSKKILVLRESTERPEGVDAGFSKLVGSNFEMITKEANWLATNSAHWIGKIPTNPYGDGLASQRILKILQDG
jgi:UDP-N-acetylglucosamine 2-epimerase (non-hydrolysing)